MRLPNHYDYDKEIDFLSEECFCLAKDVIELNEDIDTLKKTFDDLKGWLWAMWTIELLFSLFLFYLIVF